MQPKRILLIAFKFPPFAGVGAKRWAKFSKHLAQNGHKIHVVTVNWWNQGANTWTSDIIHPNIIIHRIPSAGLHNFRYAKLGQGIFGRALSALRLVFFRILSCPYYVDEAQFWGPILLPCCKRLILQAKINNVIASGHPFMANYWAARLKQKLPFINLIQDFRDPWTDDPGLSYAMPLFMEWAKQKENFAIQHADSLISVSQILTETFRKKKQNGGKTITVYNGYDQENCIPIRGIIHEQFEIIYAGNVSLDRKVVLDHFLQFIEKYSQRYQGLKLSFYGHFPVRLKYRYKKLIHCGILYLHEPLSPEDISEKIRNAFLALQLTGPSRKEALSSKLFENAALGRPVICINHGGEANEIVEEYELGSNIDYTDECSYIQVMDRWYNIWKQDKSFALPDLNIKQFSYSSLVRQIESLLI